VVPWEEGSSRELIVIILITVIITILMRRCIRPGDFMDLAIGPWGRGL
jgi:hypothetical protein